MYTNKNRKLYHTLLDLKMGFPISIKLKDGSYVLICSSESVNNEDLIWMNNITNSSLSIVINSERMKYITEKDFEEDLCSISFSENLTADICNMISSLKKEECFSIMEKAIVSFEKRQEVLNIIDLMKTDHIVPSIVIGNINTIKVEENKNFFKLKNLSVLDHKELNSHFSKTNELNIISRTDLPILMCKQTEIVSFRSVNEKKEFFALIFKKGDSQDTPLVRIHSQCITGDLLDSLKCDCGSQLKTAIKMMSSKGGIILYMPEEGRDIGFLNKIRTYEYQFHGLDTVDANHALGFDSDQRDYISASKMLKSLEIKTINLLSNNPNKKLSLEKEGIKINKSIQLKVFVANEAKSYMDTKKNKSGHIL